MGQGDSGSRLVLLDGLRGVAAITVLLYHLPETVPGDFLFERGYLMVDLFFLLSGFVLALSAEPRLASGLCVTRFMLARAVRLWPMIAIGALIGSAATYLILIDDGVTMRRTFWHGVQTLMAIFLIPSLIRTRSNALFPLNGPHWSLLFEVVANAAHALVLWRLGNRALLGVVLVFAALLVFSIMERGLNTAGPFYGYWHFAVPRLGFSYCAGIWLARQWRAGARTWRVAWPVALFLPAGCVVALAAASVPSIIGDVALVMLVFPICLWLAASAVVPGAVVPALTWLGALSYPLYAIHQPFVRVAEHFSGTGWSAIIAAAVTVLLALALAAVFERRRRHRLGGGAGVSVPVR